MNRVPPFLRWLVASVAAVAALTGLFYVKGQGQPDPLPAYLTAAPTPTSTEVPKKIDRLLVQVADSKNHIVGTALLIRGPGTLHVLNFAPHVVLDMGDAGLMDMYTAGAIQLPEQIQRGLTLASGIPIDGTLVMQRLALAGLVDAVGGVDVQSSQMYNIASAGAPQDFVTPGRNHLTGGRAASYATFLALGEAESDRIARFNAVLRAALAGLPNDPVRAQEVVSALGSLARSTIPTPNVVDALSYFNSNNLWPTATYDTIPTKSSALEQSLTSSWRRINLAAANTLISQRVGPTDLTDLPMRILVSGGLATQRLALRNQIHTLGFVFVDGGGGALPPSTQVTMRQGAVSSNVTLLLAALKFDKAPPSVMTSPDQPCDVHIIIGTDLQDSTK